MRSTALFIVMVSIFALVWLRPVDAQDVPTTSQDLKAAPWYMVLYNDTKGQLIWLNGEGVQAITSFVSPPGDLQAGLRTRDVRISPDGRYGVFEDTMADGHQSLVFYNFERARPIKKYDALPGERLMLGYMGHRSNFAPDSTRVVLLFYTFDQYVTDWRLVEFDLTTGEALHTLNRSDTSFEATMTGGGQLPVVYFAASDASVYHVVMSDYGFEGQRSFDAYAWTPATGSVLLLGPISSQFDILPPTGRLLQSFYDEAQPAVDLPGPLPIFNAVTQRAGMTAGIERLVEDDSATLLYPSWASGGAWIAYQTVGLDESGWVVRPVDSGQAYTHPGPLPQQFYGTSDGYVLTYDGETFSAATQIDGSDTHVIYEGQEEDAIYVVYITPQNTTFAPMTLAYRPPRTDPVALPTDTTCAGTPVSRLAVGMSARTLSVPSIGIQAVTLYTEPNQNMTYGIGVGTEFVISEGPVCAGGSLWWKTTVTQGSNTATGWLREADATTYYLEPLPAGESHLTVTPEGMSMGEPFNGIVGSLNQLPAETATLAPKATSTSALPTVTPTTPFVSPTAGTPGFEVDNDCRFAQPQTLQVGDMVVVNIQTLRLRETPTADPSTESVSKDVTGTVEAGPLCDDGNRLWKVAFSTGVTGWAADSRASTVYLVKQ